MNPKEKNFIRIAENRTNKIINMIELIGNLSNKSYYEYTEIQIDAIFDTIQKTLDEQRSKFVQANSSTKKFKL